MYVFIAFAFVLSLLSFPTEVFISWGNSSMKTKFVGGSTAENICSPTGFCKFCNQVAAFGPLLPHFSISPSAPLSSNAGCPKRSKTAGADVAALFVRLLVGR